MANDTITDLLRSLPKRETKLVISNDWDSSNSNSNNHNNHNNHNNINNHNKQNHNNNNNHMTDDKTTNKTTEATYHTLRYDFKPASVNSEEPATIELLKNGQVTITAPNIAGSTTTFKGQRRPHAKECLLVIDHDTGEMVLQRLTDNITVKATRGQVVAVNGNSNTQTKTNSAHEGPQLSEESSSSSDSSSSESSSSSSSQSSPTGAGGFTF